MRIPASVRWWMLRKYNAGARRQKIWLYTASALRCCAAACREWKHDLRNSGGSELLRDLSAGGILAGAGISGPDVDARGRMVRRYHGDGFRSEAAPVA